MRRARRTTQESLNCIASCVSYPTLCAEGGWQDVPDADVRYRDAMLRHGLPIDGTHDVSGPDPSGFLHTAQLACNALFALELELRQGIPLRVPVDAKKSD
jgi:hypothetical protein